MKTIYKLQHQIVEIADLPLTGIHILTAHLNHQKLLEDQVSDTPNLPEQSTDSHNQETDPPHPLLLQCQTLQDKSHSETIYNTIQEPKHPRGRSYRVTGQTEVTRGQTYGMTRHPIDRFFEASLYFKELSISQFLDRVLYIDDTHLDKSITVMTRPLTHPINDLQSCSWIGRYERLKQDLESLKVHLGLTFELKYDTIPKRINSWEASLINMPDDEASLLIDYYREDFKTFHYPIPRT